MAAKRAKGWKPVRQARKTQAPRLDADGFLAERKPLTATQVYDAQKRAEHARWVYEMECLDAAMGDMNP